MVAILSLSCLGVQIEDKLQILILLRMFKKNKLEPRPDWSSFRGLKNKQTTSAALPHGLHALFKKE